MSRNHPATGEVSQKLQQQEMTFVENKGQWNNEIKYRSTIPNGVMFLTDKGFVYNYIDAKDFAKVTDEHHEEEGKEDHNKSFDLKLHAYKVNFQGANSNIAYSTEQKQNSYFNFYIGNDKTKWKGGVGSFGKISQKNVYNGIDVNTYSKQNSLEYDFVVAPGADPNQIKLSFEGIVPTLDANGSLHFKTSVNEVIETAPITYQIINGKRTEVTSKYIISNGVLSFEFPNGYQKEATLIIDPILVFATFSGGTGPGNGYYAYSTTYDDVGNMYASCGAYNLGWPTSTGAYQVAFNGTQNSALSREVGINKYNASGTTLIYSTYYGGNNNEFPHAMKVNALGELVLVGSTNSTDLPITSGCYDNSLNGVSDVFVAHFDLNGTALIGSTYLGGSQVEPTAFSFTGTNAITDNNAGTASPLELTFDTTGNIWVVMNTNSTDMETIGGGSQNSYTLNKWICQGSSYMFGTTPLSTSGNYSQTFTTPSGCDSFVKLHLTVGAITNSVSKKICPGTSYSFGGQSYNTTGVYTHLFVSASGCDSNVTLELIVSPYKTNTVNASTCSGSNYNFGGTLLNTAGTYIDTFSTATCDSIVTLNLTINPLIYNSVSKAICAGKTYNFGGNLISTAGTYVDTFPTSHCDSIVTLNLSIDPYVVDTFQATFCTGSNYIFGSQTLTAPGTYRDTISSLSSCDKIIVLQLSNGTSNKYKYYKSICQGSSYSFGSQNLTTPGNYTDTFTTVGCDSIVTIHLEFRPNITNTVNAFMCPGGNYQFGSQSLTTPGIYTQSFPTAGCDSIVTLTLNTTPITNDTFSKVICQGTSYIFGPDTLLNAGTYTHTFSSSIGCDSTVSVQLSFLPYISTYIADSMCSGGFYMFDNDTLTTPGTYVHIYPTSGCDSVITLTLGTFPVDTFTYTENYCLGSNYYFGDTTITQVGTYFRTFTAASGCDSVVRLILIGSWANSNTLSGGIDVFLAKLNPTCDSLLYGAYIGGTGNESPTGLIFNNAGNLVVSGITNSTNFPVTSGTMHTTYQGGIYDGFVSIINPTFSNMVASTYLGTTSTDQASAVQSDNLDNIYVLGRTTGNYPISAGAWTGNTNGDIFIDQLTPQLTYSIQSTRVGNPQGGQNYFPSAFLVDICQNVYIAGYYAQAGMPLSADAQQTATAPFWFGVIEPNFTGLLYGSYFGVAGDHGHCGVSRMDPNGIVYHSICCSNTTYPGTTTSSYAPTKAAGVGQDIISFKFNFEATGVQSNFELTAGQNDTGCVAYTVAFNNTSTSATSYVWDFGDGTPQSTLENPVHTFADSGTFVVSLHANNPNTCITDDTATFNITVLKTALPDITVHDTVLCAQEGNIELSVTVNNPTVNNLFSWGPTTGIVGVNSQPTVTVDPTLNTTYYVTVKDTIPGICGFSKTDTIHIDLAPRVLDIVTNDTAVCNGTVIPIVAVGTPAYSYVWTPAIGVSDTSILQPSITANQSNIYTITGHYAACPDTAVSISIEVQQIPQLTLQDDKSVCQWTEVNLESDVTPYRPDYTYQWTPVTPNLSNPTLPNVHFNADTTIVYHLNVKTPIGCSDEDSIKITVFPGGFGAAAADTGYCPGNQANLWATGGTSYLWTPDYGLTSDVSATPTATPHTSTQYTVYITDAHNCLDTEQVYVQVYPQATIAMPDSVSIYSGEEYHLEPGTNASYFTWFPPSGISNVNVADPLFSPEVRTRYFVTATTEDGCIVNDSIDFVVKETVIDMPNAFTPNGPGNNVFKPAKRGIAQLKEFSIYNRWGNKVYSSTNIEEGWDGTQDGKALPMGVYIYTIDAVTDSGKVFRQNGNVTLVK